MKMNPRTLGQLAFGLIAVTGLSLDAAAYDYVVVDYPGAALTTLSGISNSGAASGYGGLPDGVTSVGFRYDVDKGKFTSLPAPGGYSFSALGINERGVIVAALDDTPTSQLGAILGRNGSYTTFAVSGYAYTQPRGVGASGLVTGFASNEDGSHTGFLYDPLRGESTLFDVAGSRQIIPQGINGRGQVVGSVNLPAGAAYAGSPAGQYGFVRQPSGAMTLFRVNGSPTRARGISDAGLVVGFTSTDDGNFQGFTVPAPGGSGFQALTVPASGLVVVPGAVSTFPQGIDNAGRIVGGMIDADGNQHGFVALPPSKAAK